MQTFSPQQVFYESFFQALGYSANAFPFRMLARRLPWSWLEDKRRQNASPERVFACYAGVAGFLSENSADAHYSRLKQYFAEEAARLDSSPLEASLWQYAAVRPFNHPHFRLAGWAYLNAQSDTSVYHSLAQIINSRLAVKQAVKRITRFLTVPCPPYWREHRAIGRPRTGRNPHYFFGKERITEIIANLILPFFSALAQSANSPGFSAYLEEFFLQLGAPSRYSRLRRSFQTPASGQKNNAPLALEQGLLYLKEYYCEQLKCAVCPIQNISETKRKIK